MSIAVSALIKPSRLLSRVVAAMCVLAGMAIWLAVTVAAEALPPYAGWGLAPVCAAGTVLCWRRWARKQAARQLLIASDGRIRLLQSAEGMAAADDGQDFAAWRLLPASTLWPHVMILHLQEGASRRETVVVLRDSVPRETFHALLVACRWLARRVPAAEMPGVRQN